MKNSVLILIGFTMMVYVVPSYGATAFFDDFDGGQVVGPGISGTLSGGTTTESVQGFSGLGNGVNKFGGNFHRNAFQGNPAPSSTLSLSGLPSHTSIDLNFLLAIIDSWDGEPPPVDAATPDFFNVTVDGNVVLSESFENSDFGTTQSYVPPAGVELARRVQLGFNLDDEFHRDSAYDMGLDPIFNAISHTSSTLTIEWYADGDGWQGGIDESWALDNVEVLLNGLPGDGDGNGWVDGLDYLLWAGNFGTHPGPDGDISDGDYNDDGWVDGLDYLLWAGNFGTHNSTVVPEPSSLLLAVFAMFSIVGVTRSRP